MKEEKGIKLLKTTIIFEKLDNDITDDTKTASGLYVPKEVLQTRASREFRKGLVISHGVDCMYVKAGDTIYYPPGTEGSAILDDEELWMISEEQIFAVK